MKIQYNSNKRYEAKAYPTWQAFDCDSCHSVQPVENKSPIKKRRVMKEHKMAADYKIMLCDFFVW